MGKHKKVSPDELVTIPFDAGLAMEVSRPAAS